VICILSQSFSEPTTEGVMCWLERWDVPCFRLNADDIDGVDGFTFEVRDGSIVFRMEFTDRTIDSRDVKVVWYRRWMHSDIVKLSPQDCIVSDKAKRDFNLISATQYRDREFRAASEALFSAFGSAQWVNWPNGCRLNKVAVLALAQQCGLDVPATMLTCSPDSIDAFAHRYGELITKPTSDMSFFLVGDRVYDTRTRKVPTGAPTERAWAGGFPSLVQERLDRRYELRIFYLDGRCIPTVRILRPEDLQMSDARFAHRRCVPFALPDDVSVRLAALMRRLDLDMGCIDMVRTTDDRLVFLEVNPNGQFWGDELTCNHQFEKRIASALVERLHRG
jgi:glutathione synthase/RimK-type ligase-like ATP-grasp enzyme